MESEITVHRIVKTCKRAGQYVESHTHNFFHFIFNLRGHIEINVDGKYYHTGRDDLVMIAPNVRHSVISLDTSISLDIKFSCSLSMVKRIQNLPIYVQLVNNQTNGLVRSVLEEAVGQAPSYTEMIDLRVYELIITLERAQYSGAILRQSRNYPIQVSENRYIRNALHMVEEELEAPLRVSDLAEQCGYSTNYFRLFFKEYVGVTPNVYINQRKISRAKELMLYTDLNITQISERLGYQSIHYFSRLFKKLTGMAPTEYIDRVKDNRPINLVYNENTPNGEFELPVRDMKQDRIKSRQ